MSAADEYQAVVIGSGQGGKPLCVALANAGWRTAIVEREHVGGTCVNEGCTPTKTMVASGRVAYLTHRGADYGVRPGRVMIDMKRVRTRKRDIVKLFRNGSQKHIEETKSLDLIFGEAAFTGPKSVRVLLKNGSERTLTADHIFINAGCRPAVPPLEGLADIPFLDSTSIMELVVVPKHLLVLGGGYVGLEFGQLFRRLGSKVTVVQSRDQLLTGEDADVAEEVAAILKQDGLTILLKLTAERGRKEGKETKLTVRSGKSVRTVSGSHLLVATGRVPNTEKLNLAAAGVSTDNRGFIKTNSKLETDAEGVYALGDIKGGPAFTHISYDDFRIIRSIVIEKKSASTKNRQVPYTIFIDPQLGRVGLTEMQARAQGRNIRVAKMPMSRVARALEVDETRGFMKAIVDAETNQILGAAILGLEGGEIMSAIEIAMMGKLPYATMRDGIFAHPTLAESLNNLFTAMDSGK